MKQAVLTRTQIKDILREMIEENTKDKEFEKLDKCPKCGEELIFIKDKNWKYCQKHRIIYSPEE